MKGRDFWFFLLVVVLVAAVMWWRRDRPLPTPSVAHPPGQSPAASAKPQTNVAILDGKTIDFSGGAPVVKDDAKEKADLDRSLKEMQEATKNVRFGPSAPAPDAKKAEPPPAPPKS
jgi:hypothetical protein